jgi:hypothetical protein
MLTVLSSRVVSAVTKNYAARTGTSLNYLKVRTWDLKTLNGLLVWMMDH